MKEALYSIRAIAATSKYPSLCSNFLRSWSNPDDVWPLDIVQTTEISEYSFYPSRKRGVFIQISLKGGWRMTRNSHGIFQAPAVVSGRRAYSFSPFLSYSAISSATIMLSLTTVSESSMNFRSISSTPSSSPRLPSASAAS